MLTYPWTGRERWVKGMRHRTAWMAGCALACALLVPASQAEAARHARLDDGFGSHGTVVAAVGTGDAAATAVTLQPGGEIVVAGYASMGGDDDFAIARYRADGTPDSTFGTDGVVLTDVGGADRAAAVALQADGKIVAAGSSDNAVAVVRYRPDGSPDPSFGSHGLVRTSFGGPESAEAVAVQPDGKIVVVGWVTTRQQGDMAMARYLPNGDLDANFSRDGKLTVNLSSGDYLSAIALQRDGRIVAAGASGDGATQFAVVRLRRTGTLDKAFGAGTGVVVTPFPVPAAWANAVVLQPDGMLSVAGFAYDGTVFNVALARYTPTGELDAGFGTGGEVMATLGAGDATAQSMALQPDGRIVVAGGLADDFVVARFTTDGSLDPTFGSQGSVSTDLGGLDQAAGLVLQPDGRIVVSGFSGDDTRVSFALARYLA
jgi:uncharacterized delta-60 repeat protein